MAHASFRTPSPPTRVSALVEAAEEAEERITGSNKASEEETGGGA
eukprot:CAMPEP_0175048178 /NCGR_PEP_ID=MMETSP0052_2-20121109/6022_1 /TAXON_ID=51329 ORGANISM="Polytomella parva, Strain SAG 63-3" /NCGR_SAMPLE_ID=MMETSP0052_2 /ASSEMBLY_ACC=CAM_ASM_000194 /LENGTH=44 /DNA_ID= /DNA_START= /DNA_END= /DNA_ORIENTATION=